jgi:hypothetical protein
MMTSDSIRNYYKELYTPAIKKLIEHKLSESNDLWKEKYLMIKDKSWPDCNTMQEFKNLPDWIRAECENVHGFTDLIWKKSLINDTNVLISDPLGGTNKTYAQKVLDNKQNIFVGNDVVDLACHTGSYSFAAIEAGATSVVGVEIRDELLIIANLWKNLYQIPDEKLKFIKLDLHNYGAVTDVCRNKHTVLIPGIMYHIHDHFQLLESVTSAKVENILIETGEADSISNLIDPMIWWTTEPAFVPVNGWHNNRDTVLVGYPNLAWFKLALDNLGYQHISTELTARSSSTDHNSEFLQIRSTHVFKIT